MNSKRAWLIVSIGTLAYIIGVLQRTSLGIAGVDATERFDVQAAALSSLAVLQIMVYAGLQIPVGVLLDRIGPRTIMTAGALLLVVGQVTLALAPSLWVAVLGRLLVGAGDAMTFLPASRLLASWFSGRILPFLSQALGTTGQLGQLLSAIPLSYVLHNFGWTPAYLGAASLSVLAGVLVLAIVRNSPDAAHPTGPIALRAPALHTLRESLARPGTQLGFWSHFVSQSSATMFTLLWGFPFLSVGLGYGPAMAAGLLTLITLTAIVAGPLLGLLSARFPFRRSNIVLSVVIAMGIAWTVLLAWPGIPPLWLVIVVLVVIAIGGPASIIGLDFARTFNPARSLGSASGIVNVGGFSASLIMMFLIGLALDNLSGGSSNPEALYSLDSFRLAFLVQYVVVGFGIAFMLHARGRTRRKLHAEEGIEVGPLWVSLVRMWRHRRGGASL